MHNEIFEIELKSQELNVHQQLIYKKTKNSKGTLQRCVYEQKKIIWILYRYKGIIEDNSIDWQYRASSMQLDELLTAIKIVELLNAKNLFDFEYFPEENDFLMLKREYILKQIKNRSRPYIDNYISFIFKNEKWEVNQGYDHVGIHYQCFKQGTVKLDL
jgi:hypothetical protein